MAWQGLAGGNVAVANRRCTFKSFFVTNTQGVHEREIWDREIREGASWTEEELR